jgi:hypothetical protein
MDSFRRGGAFIFWNIESQHDLAESLSISVDQPERVNGATVVVEATISRRRSAPTCWLW